ncbi:MAG TPA: ADYC domain-containing protein [Nannocystaceae bacterium]|nr:ADYC domain-containing protein [Nannocystaceae bacterium]
MTKRGCRLGLGTLLVLALAGCQEGGPDDVGDDDVEPRSGTGWSCRTCGFSNSPHMGVHPLEAFHLGSDPVDGFRLVEIRDYNNTSYTPSLSGDLLTATKGNQVKSGAQLVGWWLVFQNQAGASFNVKVYSYSTQPDWASGALVDTYSFVYSDNGELSNVCPGLDPDETSVVILPGERYDLASNTVLDKQSGWATLACRGHALAKMKMLGYDPADGYGSSASERQATLRMVTADYCGDGTSFTQLGTPLDLVDKRGSFTLPNALGSRMEAHFDLDGAVCLDTPRIALRSDVEAHCGKIPLCNGSASSSGATWITYRP